MEAIPKIWVTERRPLEECKVFQKLNLSYTTKMDVFQIVISILLVALGILILCKSRSPRRRKRERLGGNFLEESDLDDDSGFYIR